jgi:hypothetical protein
MAVERAQVEAEPWPERRASELPADVPLPLNHRYAPNQLLYYSTAVHIGALSNVEHLSTTARPGPSTATPSPVAIPDLLSRVPGLAPHPTREPRGQSGTGAITGK